MEYILYPETEARLKSSGLIDRVEKAKKEREDYPSCWSSVYQNEFPSFIEEMRTNGYFKTLPIEIEQEYKKKLEVFNKPTEDSNWIVKRKSGEVKIRTEAENFLLFSGYLASFILNTTEFWDCKKFGFSSVYDLFGSLGVFMLNKSRIGSDYRRGHHWETTFPDGRTFFSEVKGSMHGDLEITRQETTPYETLDPIGNKISYRPLSQQDINDVHGGHSVEQQLLANLLNYIQQEKISSKFIEKEFAIKLLKELKVATSTPYYGDFGYNSSKPEIFFIRADGKIPNWAEKNEETRLKFTIPSADSGFYAAFIGENKNLILARFQEDYKEGGRKAEFMPSEIDDLIKGLFIQAARQLGRTSVQQLIGTLEYWHNKVLNTT